MVHLFKQLNQHIALDVGSGSVHLLDALAFRLLSLATPPITESIPNEILQEVINEKDVHETWSELYILYKSGMLYASDDAQDIRLPAQMPLKALCMHVAHDCNLRCKYCFADTGGFGSERGCINIHTAKKAIDFLIKRSEGRRNLEVDFFGGEPLMAFDVVKQTVEYARVLEKEHGKRFRFTLTTNGILLDDDAIVFINKEMSNVVLSLDGRREINDAMRPAVNGKGSYDIIVPRFKSLADKRTGDYFVRGTFTAKNLDFVNDILHIANTGFHNISVEPVVLSNEHPLSIKEEHLPAIFEQYDRLVALMAEKKAFNFFHFNVDLKQGPCVYKRLRGCGAGGEYAAVTPDGSLYPCHQFAGREEYRLGSVLDDTFEPSVELTANHINTRIGCSECWAKYFCGGGCAAANLNTTGDINTPYSIGCAMQKKRLECAIALSCIFSETNE